MSRWVIASGGVLFCGYGPVQSSWTGKTSRATKFETKDLAEHYALLVAVEQPNLIGTLEVVDLDEWERQRNVAKHG